MSQIANHWSDSESVNIARGGSAASQPVYVDEYGAQAVLCYGIKKSESSAADLSASVTGGCEKKHDSVRNSSVIVAHIGV